MLALALFYSVWQLTQSNWSSFGGPLRYLTNWALLTSCAAAIAMAALAFGRVQRAAWMEHLVSVAAVMNMVVVVQYWRLYFDNPGNVNSNGPIDWWLEYYLHLLGPVLQWIDALVLFGAFRRPVGSIIALLALVAAYAIWAELLVGPMNDLPQGSVTSGLPYPFLNNMEFNARVTFYAINGAVVAVFYAVFWGLARFIRPRV